MIKSGISINLWGMGVLFDNSPAGKIPALLKGGEMLENWMFLLLENWVHFYHN